MKSARNRPPSHHEGCPVPAAAPRKDHVEGCRYRLPRSGKKVAPEVQHRPRVTKSEAAAIARARSRGVDIVKALDGAG
jgi:hypothetical protein